MNKTREESKLKPIDNINNKPVPISKKCQHCKETKLLSNFEFSLSIPTKDHRAVTCSTCMEKFEVEEEEQDCNCHTADCIEGKFLSAVVAQLETLLALSENGVLMPDRILGLMAAIFEQDEISINYLPGSAARVSSFQLLDLDLISGQSTPYKVWNHVFLNTAIREPSHILLF